MESIEHPSLLRFRGTILGAAAADALAFPYQHYSRDFLRSIASPLGFEYALHHSGFHPRGQYSSGTQEMLAVTESIVEAGKVCGASIASHLIPLWRDSLLIERDPSSEEAMGGLLSGRVTWESSGLEYGSGAAATRRVVPIAIWEHGDLERVCEGARISTSITHRDPRVISMAAAVAAAIHSNLLAEELILGPFLDAVSAAAGRFEPGIGEAVLDFPRVLSLSEYRALKHFDSLLADDHHPPSMDGLGVYCIPATFAALYYFLKFPYRYEHTVESCLRLGGQMGTTCLLAGAISGSLVGEIGIPAKLTDELFNVQEIAMRADELHGAWQARKETETETV
ncbi:MAG TPA: ADP-ribosylglycohydrolase family protein [Planctomycetota bacterium]|nr:ADP-ribosylglycohydrolase family protein [Planctomycetota bacterium]